MTIKQLNTICYTICILCIVGGVALSLVLIWGSVRDEIAWKGLMTMLVLFLASLLTIGINRMLERPGNADS